MRTLAMLFLLCVAGCRYEVSFKGLELDGVQYDNVFESCRKVVTRHYNGILVWSDPVEGRIQTQPLEFNSGEGLRRQVVYVTVHEREEGRVGVELMALMEEPDLDESAEDPYQWRALGSDGRQERKLLDEILGEVLLLHPAASVGEAE